MFGYSLEHSGTKKDVRGARGTQYNMYRATHGDIVCTVIEIGSTALVVLAGIKFGRPL